MDELDALRQQLTFVGCTIQPCEVLHVVPTPDGMRLHLLVPRDYTEALMSYLKFTSGLYDKKVTGLLYVTVAVDEQSTVGAWEMVIKPGDRLKVVVRHTETRDPYDRYLEAIALEELPPSTDRSVFVDDEW